MPPSILRTPGKGRFCSPKINHSSFSKENKYDDTILNLKEIDENNSSKETQKYHMRTYGESIIHSNFKLKSNRLIKGKENTDSHFQNSGSDNKSSQMTQRQRIISNANDN